MLNFRVSTRKSKTQVSLLNLENPKSLSLFKIGLENPALTHGKFQPI